jgi:hypothetical protein
VKLRLPGRRADTTTPDTTTVTPHGSTAVGVGKGRPTPKRNEAQGRRTGPVPPPPTTRKEAYRRQREQQKAGGPAVRGGERALTARDAGPVRRLVRDVVDSRRNLGSLFLVIAALLLVSLVIPSDGLKATATIVLYAFFLVLIVDSFLLARRIKRVLAERLPKENARGAVWYGVSRATMPRRWRYPKAQVPLGAEL